MRARTGPRDRRLLLRHEDPLHPRRRAGRAGAGASAASSPSARSTRWLLYQLTRRPRARDRAANASRTHALRHPRARLGRRACSRSCASRARCCRRCATRAASSASADPEWLGGADPDRRHGGRPAGRALRAGLLHAGQREEHLRHRLLPADEHRRGGAASRRAACITTIAWGLGGKRRVRARGQRLRGRRGRPVAARRARPDRERRRERGGSRARSTDTGGVYLVPAFVGPRRAVLGRARARHAGRAHARHDARAPDPRARSRRSPTRRATWSTCFEADAGLALDALRVDGGACRERLPDAVPGRRAGRARAPPAACSR